jgi:hypothetical protein
MYKLHRLGKMARREMNSVVIWTIFLDAITVIITILFLQCGYNAL